MEKDHKECLNQAIKSKNALLYLKKELGVSKSEAKNILMDYKKSNKLKKQLLFGGLATILFGVASVSTLLKPEKELKISKSEIAVAHDGEIKNNYKEIENIILKYGTIQKIINPQAEKIHYLVGQIHPSNTFNEEGSTNERITNPKTAKIQAEIFSLIRDLNNKEYLNFIVGEGYAKKKSRKDHPLWNDLRNLLQDDYHVGRFFQQNPEELGYSVYQGLFPEKVTFPEIDEEENYLKGEEIRKKISKRAKIFRIHETGALAKMDKVTLDLIEKDCKLSEERGLIYLNEGLRLAEKNNVNDYMTIIGLRHLPQMIKEYEDSRKLIVIFPKSYDSKNLEDFPLSDFEGFKKFYNFKE